MAKSEFDNTKPIMSFCHEFRTAVRSGFRKAIRTELKSGPITLQAVREVDDPWFRAHALAHVAHFAKKKKACVSITREAIEAADEIEDEYDRVAARAWPINAMIHHEVDRRLIEQAIDEALERAREITNPDRRACALLFLTSATIGHNAFWKRMDEIILETTPITRHWRGQQAIRDIVLLIGSAYPEEAHRLVESMPKCKSKRQAARRLEAGEFVTPGLFHWGESIDST